MQETNNIKSIDDKKCIYERWYGFLFHPLVIYAFAPIIIGLLIAIALPIIISMRGNSKNIVNTDMSIDASVMLFKDNKITDLELRSRLIKRGEPSIHEIIPYLIDDKVRFEAMYSICSIKKSIGALHPMMWDTPVEESEFILKIYSCVADAISVDIDVPFKDDVLKCVRDGKQKEAVSILLKCWKERAGRQSAKSSREHLRFDNAKFAYFRPSLYPPRWVAVREG